MLPYDTAIVSVVKEVMNEFRKPNKEKENKYMVIL
jgi:hypothetical protein